MANSKRKTNFPSDVHDDLKAEVASALALIEDLSTKSSDSGLSEETCWEIFGGPCPEALKKKIRSLEEDTILEEEADDFILISDKGPSKEDILTKEEQIKEETIDIGKQSAADNLEKEPQKNSSTDDKLSQKIRISKESKLSEEIKSVKKKPSDNVQENGSGLKKYKPSVNAEENGMGSLKENNKNSKDSKVEGSKVSSQASQKTEEDIKNTKKNGSKQSLGQEIVKETSKDKDIRKKSNQKTLKEASIEKIIKVENFSEVTKQNVDIGKHSADKDLNNQSKEKSEPFFIGTSGTGSKITNTSKSTQKSPMKISIGSGGNHQLITSNTANVSTSVSSNGINKTVSDTHIEEVYSPVSNPNVSSSETPLPSDDKKDKIASSDFKACNCACCVERQIRKSHTKNALKCECFKKEPVYCKCCNQPLMLSDNNFQIKIYDEDISGDPESDKKGFHITSFNGNNLNNSGVCNKRMQTSMPNIFNESRSRFPGSHMPYNVDPLYLNPGYSRPVYSNQMQRYSPTKKKKIDKKGIECSGDFKHKSAKTPEPLEINYSDEDFEYSSKSSCGSDASIEKEHYCLADSLKDALYKRSVKETVKKFENKNKYALHVYNESDHKDFHQFIGKPKNTKYKNKNPSTTKNLACGCCNEPKSIIKKRPNVPVSKLCTCCNYNRKYQ